MMALMSTAPNVVTRSPGRAWGATVFAGTRVPVEILFEYLAAGETVDEFLHQFPTVTRGQVATVLETAKEQAAARTLA